MTSTEVATGPPSEGDAKPINLSKLKVVAGDRVLVDDLSVSFPAGKLSVIVGPSGVGKSILLRIIAGLIQHRFDGIQMSGKVTIGEELVQPGMAGVVFQAFALFDELTPEANIEFAATCGKGNSGFTATEWMERLGIPQRVRTSRMSGGQRQRLALARTLAYDPPVVLYDEPTSGLDPATGARVARMIKEINDDFRKTSVVVTHDYVAWLPVADHVFLFDPDRRTVHEIPREEWNELPSRLESGSLKVASVPATPGVRAESLVSAFSRSVAGFFSGTTDAIVTFFVAVFSLLPTWTNPVWGLRFLRHYSLLIFGPTAILYLVLAGFINGYVSTFFTFEFFPFATYTEPLLIEELLEAIGFVLYRVFVPILSCILIAARCGAAVTADVGGRQYGDQLSAMATFGASPRRYLLTGIMLAFLFGAPLLTYLSWVAAKMASLMAFTWSHPERGPDFWDHYFLSRLQQDGLFFRGAEWMYAKVAISGLGIGAISWWFGVSPKYSATDVSRSVTRTILWATLLVLAVHFVFALFEFESFRPPSG